MPSLPLHQLIIWYRDIGQHITYDDGESSASQKKEILSKDLLTLLDYTLAGHKNDQAVDNFYKTEYIVKNFTWIEERQMWIYTSNYNKNKELYNDMNISNKLIQEKMMKEVRDDLDGVCSIM